MRRFSRQLGGFGRLFVFLGSVAVSACEEPASAPASWPMRPLVYTENPDQTPEAAQIQEERLTRGLLQHVGPSSTPQAPASVPALTDLDTLGRVLAQGLLRREHAVWEHAFVPADAYADLVHVELAPAQAFVDGLIARSTGTWELFEPPIASEARQGGWGALFEFVRVEPGDPRKVDGKPATRPDEIAQYWNGRVVLRYIPANTEFALTTPKILRVTTADGERFYLGAPVAPDARLRVLIHAGLHLKLELLRPEEYPFPLQVGSYWRFSRYPEGRQDDVLDPNEMASTVVEEVVAIDRFDALRLVRVRRSYNDANLTKSDAWWAVTAKRIYACDNACRRNIGDLGWMMEYFAVQVPLFVFPLKPGMQWGAGGLTSKPVFDVAAGESLELPGGVFRSTLQIAGQGPTGMWDAQLAHPQVRTFAFGKGVIHRAVQTPKGVIIESLSDYRLMPSN